MNSIDANQDSGNFNAKPVITSTKKLLNNAACCQR